jgi:hypothetical protein
MREEPRHRRDANNGADDLRQVIVLRQYFVEKIHVDLPPFL